MVKEIYIALELKCVECSETEKLELHEIHFKKHPTSALYFLLHYEDFIILCHSHHRLKHRANHVKGIERMRELKRLGRLANKPIY